MNTIERDTIKETSRMIKSVRDSMNIILTEATVDDYDYLLPYSKILNDALKNLTEICNEEEQK